MAARARTRSFLFTLFILALMGLTVYNAWQIRVLRAEVSDLMDRVAALHGGNDAPARGAVEKLQQARRHADLARKHIASGEFRKAKTEMDRSLQLMKSAGDTTDKSSKDAANQLQKTLKDAGDALERMWQGVTEKPKVTDNKGG
ncbi:MAG: hypothetical protein KBC96_11835 [Armatimonadetes bacterium]|nr:hypothetical protein [Armatimonadota bacterium]